MDNSDIIRKIYFKYFKGKESGVFVEAGAVDGVHRSLTKMLYKKGWRGYNFEPNKITYEKLTANRSEDTNINRCLHNENTEVDFFISKSIYRGYEGGGCSIDEEFIKNKKLEYFNQRIKTITFDSFVQDYNVGSIDLMILDVEGAELNVLDRFKYSKTLPDIILVEDNKIDQKALLSLMTEVGYINDSGINVGGGNKLFIKKKYNS